ncbi:MAG TPA: ABC transporter permease [Candidatus Avidehalobacter gallistercoris]|uniref:ABC transporter permease n=1 Tax=Candidatus Avidehalobacter gallistercoris TaxID=2840694 RepID=A0A9D1KYA0_9FIRM|nr:ABC transporter permease [Candidatus Avidehalobacter gallistercoris]
MLNIILGAIALGSLWAVMTMGVYITFRLLDIADLSVEGTLVTGAAVGAVCITGGMNPWAGTLLALLVGLICGAVTGLLHTKLKIPALLAGILTMIALYSVNLRIMGRANIALLNTTNVFTPLEGLPFMPLLAEHGIMTKNVAILICGLLICLVVSAILYWFFGTELGSAIRATGNNPQMVRAQGVNTDTMILLGLMLSNGLVAMSGALIAQNQSYADVQMGTGAIVIGLASVIIGEVLFGTKSFKRTLLSLTLGAITYRVIIALVLKAGMPANDLKLFTAITVAICLALPQIKAWWNKLKGGKK